MHIFQNLAFPWSILLLGELSPELTYVCHLNADFNHDDFILKRLLSPKCGFLKYLKMQRFLVSKNESLNVQHVSLKVPFLRMV